MQKQHASIRVDCELRNSAKLFSYCFYKLMLELTVSLFAVNIKADGSASDRATADCAVELLTSIIQR